MLSRLWQCGTAAVFVFLVVLPLLKLFTFISTEDINKILSSSDFKTNLIHSVTAASLATALTVCIAFLVAYTLSRSAIKGKKFFAFIFTIPMLIPSISHGIAIMRLFGTNGILTRLFGAAERISGLGGIVLGSFMYAFPVAFLMLFDILRYEDSSVYSAAEILGIGKVRTFFRVTLSYMRKPLIITIFAIFAMVVTDYGVPIAVGGRYGTIPQVIYSEVIGRFNFGAGSVYSAVLLIPAVAAFLSDILLKERSETAFVKTPYEPRKGSLRDAAAYVLCGGMSIIALLPVAVFTVIAVAKNYPHDMSFSLRSLQLIAQSGGSRWLFNSLVIAILTAAAGIVVAYTTAYLVVRADSSKITGRCPRLVNIIHIFAMLSMMIPGIVLGLTYILVYKTTFFYGTIFILVMVNIAHFISSPYLMIYNSMKKVNENLEQVGATLGLSRMRIITGVLMPQQFTTICEMFSYFFVNCMITISAVSFLSNSRTKPISLMINVYEEQMNMEAVAMVSLIILVCNLLTKGLVSLLAKAISNREEK